MKHILLGLTLAAVALAQHPNVSDCFKVHSMIRADEEHYWTTWTNTCPYTIDSVYVMVRFSDYAAREVADGVWSLHFIEPGAHRTMRFSAPGKLADFAAVRQQKITADIEEAFARSKPALSPAELAAVTAYREAVARDEIRRTGPPKIVNDSGEPVYRVEAQSVPIAPVVRASKVVGDTGEASFRTDFPDAWRAVLSSQESAVSRAPRASFVRFVTDDKPPLR